MNNAAENARQPLSGAFSWIFLWEIDVLPPQQIIAVDDPYRWIRQPVPIRRRWYRQFKVTPLAHNFDSLRRKVVWLGLVHSRLSKNQRWRLVERQNNPPD